MSFVSVSSGSSFMIEDFKKFLFAVLSYLSYGSFKYLSVMNFAEIWLPTYRALASDTASGVADFATSGEYSGWVSL